MSNLANRDLDNTPTNQLIAYDTLSATFVGEDIDEQTLWELAQGDISALNRLPSEVINQAYELVNNLEALGTWTQDDNLPSDTRETWSHTPCDDDYDGDIVEEGDDSSILYI